DTPRILTLADGNIDRVKLLFLFQLTFTGTPCIYYGDEVGMSGGGDPSCRACMVWESEKQNQDLFHYVQALITLRKSNDVYANDASFQFLDGSHDENTIIYERKNDSTQVMFVVNNQATPTSVKLLTSGSF